MTEIEVAFLEKLGAPLQISTVKMTGRLAPAHVLVEIESIGICGSQLLEIAGKKGNAKFLPHMLGHEGVGRVVDIGSTVSTVRIGDRVILHWRKGAGGEAPPAEFQLPNGEVLRSGPISTFSRSTIVSENRVTAIVEDIDSSLGTLLGCGLSTGLGAIDRDVDLGLGDAVLVLGGGGVGLSAAIGAHLKGASTIVVADSNLNKKSVVERVPRAKFVDTSGDEWIDIARAHSPRGYQIIIEATGSDKLRMVSSTLLGKRGTVVMLGQDDVGGNVNLGPQSAAFGSEGTRVVFSQGGSFVPETDIERYAKVLSGRDDLTSLLYSETSGPLSQINRLINEFSLGLIHRPILNLTP